jgi:UDP-N-acetylglucosamine 2-epimerase
MSRPIRVLAVVGTRPNFMKVAPIVRALDAEPDFERANTERPITIELGTNRLLGLAPERIAEIPELLSTNGRESHSVPPGWDGQAASRIRAGRRPSSMRTAGRPR